MKVVESKDFVVGCHYFDIPIKERAWELEYLGKDEIESLMFFPVKECGSVAYIKNEEGLVGFWDDGSVEFYEE